MKKSDKDSNVMCGKCYHHDSYCNLCFGSHHGFLEHVETIEHELVCLRDSLHTWIDMEIDKFTEYVGTEKFRQQQYEYKFRKWLEEEDKKEGTGIV